MDEEHRQPGESRLETFLLDSAALPRRRHRWWPRLLLLAVLATILLCAWWSRQPEAPDVAQVTAGLGRQAAVPGAVSVATVIDTVRVLLEKPGGFTANDALPPGVLLDDMPAFENGALQAVRDYLLALRRDFSRAETQFVEDPDLVRAESRLLFDSSSWLVPPAEGEYQDGMQVLARYLARLVDAPQPGARFHPRADNFARWLSDVGQRLDRYGRDLVASGTGNAAWSDIDNGFFAARGYCWALRVQLLAAEHDFAPVLAPEDRQLLADAVRALDGTQSGLSSPVILNGSEYGLLANHSLVLAGHVTRAAVALGALRTRLSAATVRGAAEY